MDLRDDEKTTKEKKEILASAEFKNSTPETVSRYFKLLLKNSFFHPEYIDSLTLIFRPNYVKTRELMNSLYKDSTLITYDLTAELKKVKCRTLLCGAEADFVSEDVYGVNSPNNGNYNSEAAINAYYKLLNCGFRIGLAAGTDFPCNDLEPLGKLLTYVKVKGQLTYNKWVEGIKNGKTLVSRKGHNEFIEMKINEKYGPGDEIKFNDKGTVAVEVKWTTTKETTGRIELVANGKVIASKEGTAEPGVPLVLKTTQIIDKSSWICARRMTGEEHASHSAAAYITVNNKPVRASAADAQFFVSWIDNILKNIAPSGKWNRYFTHDLDIVMERYIKARNIYSNIAAEASK